MLIRQKTHYCAAFPCSQKCCSAMQPTACTASRISTQVQYRVSTYFHLAQIQLSKAVCYEGLIILESDESEEQGP